jgi:hypothetical protein
LAVLIYPFSRSTATALLASAVAVAFSACTPPALITALPPASGVQSCAWFGDAREGVLYFGISPFWRALREGGGDPRAELRFAGAREIGRFDLARERMLAPLAITPAPARSGVWDVLAHPNGGIYFTTFWENAGRVDPASGRVEWFVSAGEALNELALLPDGRVLASRYGRGGASGSVVVLSERGEVLAEHALTASEGIVAAAKSVAYDAARDAIWVNTDLLPASGAPTHDARIISLRDGRELARWSDPELQFMTFAADGTGFLVERSAGLLVLRVLPPGARGPLPLSGRFIPLDEAFPAALDFAQDVKLTPEGNAIVTRWSGVVHIASPDGEVRRLDFPKRAGALYYTGVAKSGEICATRCGAVEVVCEAVPH